MPRYADVISKLLFTHKIFVYTSIFEHTNYTLKCNLQKTAFNNYV